MKSYTQVVLLVVLVMALVGGVAFVSQFNRSSDSPVKVPGTTTPAVGFLRFSPKGHVLLDDAEEYTAEGDFWIKNLTAEPVELRLQSLAPPAATAQITWLTAEEIDGIPIGEEPSLEPGPRWQPLPTDGPVVTVPAPGKKDNTVGILRLSWQGKQASKETPASATLWLGSAGSGRKEEVHAAVTLVPAIQVDSEPLKLRDLSVKGQQESVEFLCWSATRLRFPLRVQRDSLGPNTYCAFDPLSEEQCRELARTHENGVRSGYRVRVTVQERRDKEALDLGMLERKLVLQGPPGAAPVGVKITGKVRGEVKLLAPGNGDSIDLGSFPTAAGKKLPVTLGADDANVELHLEGWAPRDLDVQLSEPATVDGQKRWTLDLKAEPRAVVGPLPADSKVVLKVQQGGVTRRMLLPLRGQGTQ